MTNPPPPNEEGWFPKSREDWVGLFSDGALDADRRRAEAEAERLANEPPKTEEEIPPKKLTFAEKLMGGK